jgi:hypothetical protein
VLQGIGQMAAEGTMLTQQGGQYLGGQRSDIDGISQV